MVIQHSYEKLSFSSMIEFDLPWFTYENLSMKNCDCPIGD